MSSRSFAPQRSFLVGCGLVLLSGLILSLGVICVRGTRDSDAFQYLFWRALGFAAAVSVIAAFRHSVSPIVQVRRMSRFGWLAAVAMVFSQIAFIAAIKATTVAEVFFLMSLAPLIAAAIAYPLLGERIGLLGAVAIALALGGVALMTGGGLQGGGWDGRLLALGGALSFALYSLALRGARTEDLDAVLVAAGGLTVLACLAVMLALRLDIVVPAMDLALALTHGAVVLAVGLILLGWGSRSVPAVTLIMLAQSESIAAPLWSYLFFGETTTRGVVAGGALILMAVVLQATDGARQQARSDGQRAT